MLLGGVQFACGLDVGGTSQAPCRAKATASAGLETSPHRSDAETKPKDLHHFSGFSMYSFQAESDFQANSVDALWFSQGQLLGFQVSGSPPGRCLKDGMFQH